MDYYTDVGKILIARCEMLLSYLTILFGKKAINNYVRKITSLTQKLHINAELYY